MRLFFAAILLFTATLAVALAAGYFFSSSYLPLSTQIGPVDVVGVSAGAVAVRPPSTLRPGAAGFATIGWGVVAALQLCAACLVLFDRARRAVLVVAGLTVLVVVGSLWVDWPGALGGICLGATTVAAVGLAARRLWFARRAVAP